MSVNKKYNKPIKDEFLNSYKNEGTRNTLQYDFYRSYELEYELQKDLYDFSRSDIEKLMHNREPKEVAKAKNHVRNISNYINWAINRKYRKTPNPLIDLDGVWYEQFIDKQQKRYLTIQELTDLEDNLVNYQDKIILRLVFEGVYGSKCSELINLKYEDVKNGRLILTGRSKPLKVSERLLYLINRSKSEVDYQSKNGKSSARAAKKSLRDTGYVIRPAIRKGSEMEKVNSETITQRIKRVSEEFNMPYLGIKSIQRSGMIYLAQKLLRKNNKTEIEQEESIPIGKRYNLSKINNNGYSYYNTSVLKEYINIDVINSMYDPLVPQSIEMEQTNEEVDFNNFDLNGLRRIVIKKPKQKVGIKKVTIKEYERDPWVKAYALKRAKGICEACENEAPFFNVEKEPFLEVHHIKSLSEEGIDGIFNVAAVCPNCHRRIHYGVDGEEYNRQLQKKIAKLERIQVQC